MVRQAQVPLTVLAYQEILTLAQEITLQGSEAQTVWRE
jgi:hypothetical protein